MFKVKQKETNSFLIGQEIRALAITAIFLSLSLIFKYLGQFMPITGFPLEIELIVYSIGLIAIFQWRYKIIFLIISPILWMLVVPPFAFNFLQTFVEYFLPQMFFIFLPIVFYFLKESHPIKISVVIAITLIIVYAIKCGWHIIAGYYWWTPGSWTSSVLINLRIIGTNLAIQLPISIVLIYIMLKNNELSKMFFHQPIYQKNKKDPKKIQLINVEE